MEKKVGYKYYLSEQLASIMLLFRYFLIHDMKLLTNNHVLTGMGLVIVGYGIISSSLRQGNDNGIVTKVTVVKEYIYPQLHTMYQGHNNNSSTIRTRTSIQSEKIPSYKSGHALVFLKEEAIIHKLIGYCLDRFLSEPSTKFTCFCDKEEAKELTWLNEQDDEDMMAKFNHYLFRVGLEVMDIRIHPGYTRSGIWNDEKAWIEMELIGG